MRKESLDALGAIPLPAGWKLSEDGTEILLPPGVRAQALPTRLENLREHLPDAVGAMARVVADNPKSLALVACGSYVLTSALMRAVRPRGLPGILAVAFVSASLSGFAAGELVKRGVLEIRVRDGEGRLMPPRPRDDA